MTPHELALSTIGTPVSVSVRLNPFKPCPPPRDAERVPWCEWGYILSERPSFTLDPLFHAGAYYVQDASAMYVGHVLRGLPPLSEGRKGLRVLDLCAAPGGKTTDAAASLRLSTGGEFELTANEVMRSRASVLKDNVAVWGDPSVQVTSVDPAAFASLGGYYDIIIADVPCSGEGMFRKDPRAVQEWSEANVKLCAERQRRILSSVWPALKEGGYLVYSTCTFEPCENDENLQWAAAQLGGEILPQPTAHEGVELTQCGSLLVPGRVKGEGQWVGALQKTSSAPRQRARDISSLHPLHAGIRETEDKGGIRVPSPDYALSMFFDRTRYPVAELDRATALAYLHRESIVLPDAPRGYVAVSFEGHPLGFVKNLGSRCNNLLPCGRRILMDTNR
ncbi:MAG: hypothetical protein IJS07_05755 [Bacteroidales bacterium]|nr:hypothetical protein [Bacteroidales bacterium]